MFILNMNLGLIGSVCPNTWQCGHVSSWLQPMNVDEWPSRMQRQGTFFLKSVATWNFFVCLFFSSWLAWGCASQASGLTYLRPIPLKVCRGIFNVCESHTFGEHMPPISSFKVCGPYCRYFQLYIQNGELAYMYSNCGSWNCHFKLQYHI